MRRRVFVNDGTGAIRNADQIKMKPRELSNKDRSRVSQIYELLIRLVATSGGITGLVRMHALYGLHK